MPRVRDDALVLDRAIVRERMREHLDANGDLAPPWEKYPEYERYTIGWRMGSGESWLRYWAVFLEDLGRDPDVRLAYLARHAPAPFTWSERVHAVLHPDEKDPDDEDDDDGKIADERDRGRRARLVERGLVAPDVAYRTWLSKQDTIVWPWERSDTPEDAARYWTRDMAFWSRQVQHERASGRPIVVPAVAPEWDSIAQAVRVGSPPPIDPSRGLALLAHGLAAGVVVAPWHLGLAVADFADSFDDSMAYVDAFRLWGMSAFDDAVTVAEYMYDARVPDTWRPWVAEHFLFP